MKLPWRIILFVVGFIVVQFVVTAFFGVLAVLYWVTAGNGNLEAVEAMRAWLENPDVTLNLQMVAALPTVAGMLGLVWFFRKYVDRRAQPLRSTGLYRPPLGISRVLGGGTAAGALPIMVCVVIISVLSGYIRSTGGSMDPRLIALTPTFVLLAFNEELVFRGYILRNFVEEHRPVLGVVVSSVLFWIIHGLNPAAWSSALVSINLFGAGVVLALVYLYSGALWFPTVMHFFWNFTQGVVFGLPVSGIAVNGVFPLKDTGALPTWVTGGDFGLEGSVLVTAVEIALAALFGWLWVRKREQQRRANVPRDPVG